MARKTNPRTYSSGRWIRIPYAVLKSANYAKLSREATKLLLDLIGQTDTTANGALVVTMKAQSKTGWKNNRYLYRSRDELLHYGFITQTRQGGRNRASWYRLTYMDTWAGGMDVAKDPNPSDEYKLEVDRFEPKKPRKKPEENNIVVLHRSTSCTPWECNEETSKEPLYSSGVQSGLFRPRHCTPLEDVSNYHWSTYVCTGGTT